MMSRDPERVTGTATDTRNLDVLVVGDANPDLILRGDVVPRFAQSEQLLDGADLTLGGSGAIFAHGLARLGLTVALVAVLGDDVFGAITRQPLIDAGVDVTHVRTDPVQPTGLSVVLIHGQTRTTLTVPGCIAALEPEAVTDGLLARARHLHACSFYLQPRLAAGLTALFTRARALGVGTSLDTNLDPADTWAGLDDVLPVTDVLLPNRREVMGMNGRLTGEATPRTTESAVDGAGAPDADRAQLIAAAREVAARGPLVVVKDGDQGAVIVRPGSGEVTQHPAFPVEAVDTTGAGDSFDAAFIAGHLRGMSLADCLAMACRAGALSTRGIGGTTAQASADEVAIGTAPAS